MKFTGDTCVRCGTKFMFASRFTTLVGNYETTLCADCLNVWTAYIDLHPVYVALFQAEVDHHILSVRTCGDGVDRTEELKELFRIQRESRQELFRIAGAWLAETKQAKEAA